MPADIHVLETGQGWEVWRLGDSMPLGTYPTEIEADEMAAAQAARDGSNVRIDERDIEVDQSVDDAMGGNEPAP